MLKIYRAGEQELIDGCRRGDRKAQQRLYDKYAPKMFPVCIRYMKDTMAAEDVLVMAFARIFKKIDQYTGKGNFEGWIKTIMIREALQQLRKNNARFHEVFLEPEMLEMTGQYVNPAMNDYHLAVNKDDVLAMIASLPDGYRTVFNLYALDGYSHQEIADQLGISENTSKSQLSRARSWLQQKWKTSENLNELKTNDKAAPSF